MGNNFFPKLIEKQYKPKPEVNSPNDKYEQKAVKVADKEHPVCWGLFIIAIQKKNS
jgi:hypothetical protein